MDIRVISTQKDINYFLEGLNKAFEHRSNEKIPFSILTAKDLEDEYITMILAVFEEDTVVGGLCVKESIDNGLKVFKISHVWTKLDHQGQGIASQLLDYCELFAEEKGVNYLQLNVANCYLPAVYLYLKHGFKKLKIYANVPGTYYFIRMVKAIKPFAFSKLRIQMSYIKSVVVFYLLFNQESTPTLLNRIIYGRKK